MTICVICGEYYRLNSYHSSKLECQNCIHSLPLGNMYDGYSEEVNQLVNPTGKTKPVFYDDYDREDSHGF